MRQRCQGTMVVGVLGISFKCCWMRKSVEIISSLVVRWRRSTEYDIPQGFVLSLFHLTLVWFVPSAQVLSRPQLNFPSKNLIFLEFF